MKKINELLTGFIGLFSSVRFTIILLIILAIVMVVGTVIPQNQDHQRYINLYGRTIAKIFEVVQFTEIFHSYLFIVLLSLFGANTLVCVLTRLKILKRILLSPRIRMGEAFFDNLRLANKFTVSEGVSEGIIHRLKSYLTERGYKVSSKRKRNKIALLFQKGKWGRLGPELVHFSILVILMGALIGGISGFSTRMSIPEGKSLPIPGADNYSIKLINFSIQYYPHKFSLSLYEPEGRSYKFAKRIILQSGEQKNYHGLVLKVISRNGKEGTSTGKLSLEARRGGKTKVIDITENHQQIILPGGYGAIFNYYVKQYSSQVVIMEDSDSVIRKDTIQVNHPLKFQGINFYQQAYKEGTPKLLQADWVLLEAYQSADNGSKLLWKKKIKVGEKVQVTKNLFVTPTKVFPDLIVENGKVKNRSYSLNNPAVYLHFSTLKDQGNGANDLDRWIFQKFGDVHYQRVAQSHPQMPRFKLVDFGPITNQSDISILKVSSQPGLGAIYGGCGLLMIGLIFSFYIFHRRIWVLVDKKSGKLLIGGKCNKKVESFDLEMNEVFKIADTRRG